MVVINLKIRTLEGNDSLVSVDEEIPLSEFRERVEEVTSIEKGDQRLIFRGKALLDEAKSLKAYGIEDDMTLHLVKRRPVPAASESASSTDAHHGHQQATFDEQHHHRSRAFGHSISVSATMERTQLFSDPDTTMSIIRQLLDRLGSTFDLITEATLRENQPNNDDFTINVALRGRRESTVDSPARERFDHLKKELKKLAWMASTVKVLFHAYVDAILADSAMEPSDSVEILANILQGMYSLDFFASDELRTLHTDAENEPMLELIEQLENWELPEDEEHHQTLDNEIIMRHVTSSDYALLLQHVTLLDSYVQEHLLSRYCRVLAMRQTHEASSYAARLLNCFTTAISRVQHRRAHIIHTVSDFGIHVDQNPHSRIFPQYALYERDDPPEATMSFIFGHPRNNSSATHVNDIRPRRDSRSGGPAQVSQPSAGAPNIPSISPMNGSLFSLRSNTPGGSAQPGQRVVIVPGQAATRQPQRAGAYVVSMGQHPGGMFNFGPPPHGDGGANAPFVGGIQQHLPQGFRIPRPPPPNNAGQGQQPSRHPGVSFQVGDDQHNRGGISPQAEISITFETHHEPQTSGASSSTSGPEPMDTDSRGDANQPGQNQQQRNFQSSMIGRALSDLMSMASQFGVPMGAGGTIPFSNRNQESTHSRSNPSLVDQAQNSQGGNAPPPPPRRSNSTSRLFTAAPQRAQDGTRMSRGVGPDGRPPSYGRIFQQGVSGGSGTRNDGGVDGGILRWRQWTANSPYALFIGERPPTTIPLYTADPYLPCASRRLRSFELDARHSNFWNDPATIASGRRLRERASTSDNDQTAQPDPDANMNPPPRAADIPLNSNGESVFNEEETFREYIFGIFEQVALRLHPGTVTNTNRDNTQEPPQVFGYSPAMMPGMPMMFPPGAHEFMGMPSFQVVATAEIPITQPQQQPPSTGTQTGNSTGQGQNRSSSSSYHDPMDDLE
ncbi:ubiquitin family domain-containing protein [Ditylenchus destructor]|nr:ubiquitin family domain-containing protein [Ditylenchus destructor]